jgi:hypothetical protein
MSIKKIRNYYNVPAKIRGKIKFTNGSGCSFYCTIISTSGRYLRVKPDAIYNESKYWLLHPTWNIEYL